MKRIYSILLTAVALIAFFPTLSAQKRDGSTFDGNFKKYSINEDGIGYSKDITGPNDDGVYTIHLHTFVTGEGTVTHSNLPADVVLVLDVSGSMDESLTTYSYTERASQGYSYNSFSSGWSTYEFYYKHTDGNYYRVQRQSIGGGWFGTSSYRLYYTAESQTWYLSGSGASSTTEPASVSGSNTIIWTGVLYSRTSSQTRKIEALKTSVNAFIDMIKTNDKASDGTSLENQISIVKFASPTYYDEEDDGTSTTETGNHKHSQYNSDERTWMEPGAANFTDWHYRNPTEIVKGFTLVSEGEQALRDAINSLEPGGATAADYGMAKALALVNTLYNSDGTPKRQSNKTIVFFTDGSPTYSDGFQNSVANSTIAAAKDIKAKLAYSYVDDDNVTKNVNVSVYSVGVFDGQNSTRDTYMQYTSSNYPTASSLGDAGTGGDPSGVYYQDASEGDLEDVFRKIGASTGGNSVLGESTITAVDVVSQSFDIPDGASGEVLVFEAPILTATEDTLIFKPMSEWIENPDGVTVIPDEDNPNKITASGFDYAEKWCGILTVDGEDQPHGSKLVLLIPITMADDAVGGPGVETNGPGSGIYVDNVNRLKFESPTVDLPVNLQVKKVGLEEGESAKFMIQRIPKTADPATATNWEDVTTIFVTKKDSTDPDVYIRGLDPTYYYRILEDEWDWSYNFNSASGVGYITDSNTNEKTLGDVVIEDKESVTSDKFVTNPITFSNTKKTNIQAKVHHAESKATNTFNGSDPEYTGSKPRVTNSSSSTTPTEEGGK